MTHSDTAFRLRLIGPFRLERNDGTRIEITSKRSQALLAMLAGAGSAERSRLWLQDRLWGARAPEQAAASLRRELSNLRQLVNIDGKEWLFSAHGRVWLNLDQVDVDCRALDQIPDGEFLEGIDVPGEEMFEDWLRSERQRIEVRQSQLVPKAAPSNVATDPPATSFAARSAIAVLPFEGEGESEQIAHGLAEDLIDRLSRLRWLPVIARNSSFAVPTEKREPRAAGSALQAQYIVEGSIRDQMLTVSLIDTENGQCLWNGRSPLPGESDLATIDSVLTGITVTLGFRIDQSEQQRAMHKAQSDLNVRELIWRGRWHLSRLTRDDADAARVCFEQALQREPNSPEALIQMCWVQLWALWATRGAEEEIRNVRKLTQRAIIADYEDARGHMLAGIAEIWLRQPLRAEALLRRAIELNPSLVMAHAQLGSALHLKGDHKGAIDALQTAIRLSPNDPDLFYTFAELAMAMLFEDRLDDALLYAEYALARRSGYWIGHVAKVTALARLGRHVEANSAYLDLERSNTGFRDEYIDWVPFVDSSKQDFLKDGLNLARSMPD
jgi:TolB-like protein